MTYFQTTPLNSWIAHKIGLPQNAALNRSDLQTYQLEKLRKTVEHAKENSPFYACHLSKVNTVDNRVDLKSLDDIASLPFTTSQDLASHGLQMLCVSQSQIARVITLQTSGTTASPKRIYFTEEDLELTADFFTHGMQALVASGDRVMVLMPGPNLGSVGERLAVGLDRIGCPTVVYGLVQHPGDVIDQIVEEKIDCLIGLPAQVLSLVRHPRGKLLGGVSGSRSINRVGGRPVDDIRRSGTISSLRPGRIKSVLLSADYVPRSIIEAIEKAWHCPVFTHWGMTETGLGGGVQCQAREGYHLREADLWIEIVDPKGGEPVPDGVWGEIVLTTLTRTGMPLIRYRTGDISRFLTEPCPCGSHLKRLDRVRGRSVYEFSGAEIRLDEMDEAIFALPEIVDFQGILTLFSKTESETDLFDSALTGEPRSEIAQLSIVFWTTDEDPFSSGDLWIGKIADKIRHSVEAIPSIKALIADGQLGIDEIHPADAPVFSGSIKRRIKIKEN